MATMSGSTFMPPSPASAGSPPPVGEDSSELFANLVVSNPRKHRVGLGFPISIATHTLLIGALILVPIFWPEALPEPPNIVARLIYDPPPPPPPPLPRGSAMVTKPEPARPTTPDLKPEKPAFTSPVETPRKEEELKPEAKAPESEQAGSPTGSDMGLPEGMEEGIAGGVVGGVPGGVVGGVIGGTGTVMDWDQGPRPIRTARPQYPQEAFVKKVEGEVLVEILIDANGRVVKARVIKSIPLLDAAAVQAVMQWEFIPAVKHGRPVATIAHAPVKFRIY